MFRGILIGVVIGYFFKPQIEVGVRKLADVVKANLKKGRKNSTTEE